MAFVPVDFIHVALDVLNDAQNALPLELQSILDWMEDNCIGRINRNAARRNSLYPIRMWNEYERTLDRTNNHAEMARQRLQFMPQMDHPFIWKFIRGLRTIQKERDMQYELMVAGNPPPAKRRKYHDAVS